MLYLGINYYESEIMKKNQQISSLNVELYHASNELTTLSENNLSLNNENIQLSNELMALSDQNLQSIEPLREYDKQAYMMMYDEIYYTLNERPQTIYDNTSTDEFDMICRVIEAEIGNGNIDQKINVATCIINRYLNNDTTWYEILTENNQFTTVSNGAWNRVEVTESTRLALEYAWLFPNEELGDATYFKSGSDSWHDNCDKLEEVHDDKKHKFYVEREDN